MNYKILYSFIFAYLFKASKWDVYKAIKLRFLCIDCLNIQDERKYLWVLFCFCLSFNRFHVLLSIQILPSPDKADICALRTALLLYPSEIFHLE